MADAWRVLGETLRPTNFSAGIVSDRFVSPKNLSAIGNDNVRCRGNFRILN